MPSTAREYAVRALRAVLVGGGLLFAVGVAYTLLTLEQPPPGSDGFVTGLAYVFGGAVLLLALGATGLGVALPSILGTDDALGFGRSQRLVLKAAGVLFVGGFLVGVGVAATVGFQFGLLSWFVAIVFGVLAVGVALGWRLVEAVVSRVHNPDERAS
jgi:hypothetical protein